MIAAPKKWISYAQNYEDVMLWRALRDIKNGFYIDIGAFSPDVDSVTRHFYESGWSGINVEPNGQFLDQLRDRRSRDINLGVAISNNIGTSTFYTIGSAGLSTLDHVAAKRASEAGWVARPQTVTVTTLAEVWEKNVPIDREVQFLKIDVEGHEESVIRGADWARHRPWIIVVEATAPNSSNPSHSTWDPLLQGHGYSFVWFDGLNRFYVAREHSELTSAFMSPPNVFDGFKKLAEVDGEASLKREADLNARIQVLIAEREAGLKREADANARLQVLIAEREAGLKREADANARLQVLIAEREVGLKREADANAQLRALIAQFRTRSRPIWEHLFFHRSGKPRRLLRRILFHNSGEPRRIFRGRVLRPNGTPRSAFYLWMTSPVYQALPAAARFPLSPAGQEGLSTSVDSDWPK